MDLQEVGERIKQLRGRMSQLQFGCAVSVQSSYSQNYISAIEKGKTKPSIEILEAISWFRDVPIDFIITGCNFIPSDRKIDLNIPLAEQLSDIKEPLIENLLETFDKRIKAMVDVAESVLSLHKVELEEERLKRKNVKIEEIGLNRQREKTAKKAINVRTESDIINEIVLLNRMGGGIDNLILKVASNKSEN